MSRRAGAGRRQSGISYLEVLVATLVVALTLVPALEALEVGVRGSGIYEQEARLHLHAFAKLEEVLAEPFSALALESAAAGGGPTSYSDAAGSPDRRLVFLSGYDADGSPGDDPGILHVRVEVEATSHVLETLTSL